MANIPQGYGIIAGRGKENAQRALAAAIAAKLDTSVVRTVTEGYLVPEAALKEFEKARKAEAEPTDKPAPKPRGRKPAASAAAKTDDAPAESESDNKEE